MSSLMDIINGVGNDVNSGYAALTKILSQPKTHSKTNGAISNSPVGQAAQQVVQPAVNNFKTSPVYDLLSGNASKVPRQLSQDISSTNNQLKGGNISPIMGLLSPDSVGESGARSPIQLESNALHKQYGIRSPQRVKEVQQTLNNEVPGSNPTEVYNNLHPTIERLGSEIDQVVGNNPSTASKIDPNGVTYQSLAEDMQAKAQAKGLMKDPKSASAVNKAIAQQINHISQNAGAINTGSASTSFSTPVFNEDLTPATIKGNPSSNQTQFRRMGGAKPGTKGPPGYLKEVPIKNGEVPDLSAQPSTSYNPSQMASGNEKDIAKAQVPLDMSTLRSEYRAANIDKANLLERRSSVNARPLTDAESAQLLYRDSLKDKIAATDDMRGTNDQKIGPLISKQHDIYDAQDIISNQSTDFNKQSKTANQPSGSFLGNLKQGIINHPIGSIATGTSLLTGAGILGYTAKVALSTPKNYQFSSGNVNLPALSDVSDANGNSLGDQNAANYLSKLQSINDQEKTLALQNRLHLPGADAKLAQLETDKQTLAAQNGKIAPVINQYIDTQNALTGLQSAQNLIKNANPQWFQAYGPIGSQLTGIRSALVPGYSSFIQQLNSLKSSGIDVSAIANAASPEAADAAIQTAVKYYQNKLKNTLQASGYQLPSNSSGPGGQLLDAQIKKINTGSPKLDAVLSPTPTAQPETSPTPDQFQQLLHAKYQQGVN